MLNSYNRILAGECTQVTSDQQVGPENGQGRNRGSIPPAPPARLQVPRLERSSPRTLWVTWEHRAERAQDAAGTLEVETRVVPDGGSLTKVSGHAEGSARVRGVRGTRGDEPSWGSQTRSAKTCWPVMFHISKTRKGPHGLTVGEKLRKGNRFIQRYVSGRAEGPPRKEAEAARGSKRRGRC